MLLATAAMSGSFDAYTIQTMGVPSLTLMERAARAVADRALAVSGGTGRAAVFAGGGNNGGDGLAAARMLHEAGLQVRVWLTGPGGRLSPDGAVMLERLTSSGVRPEKLEEADEDAVLRWLRASRVAVDAVCGFGFRLPLRGEARRACALMNASGVPVVAVDLPSGVEADTGLAAPDAVRAAHTVTFTSGKPGLFVTPGALLAGRVELADIGVTVPAGTAFPWETVEGVTLPPRPRDAHKGNFGRVLILAGSRGYTGAPAFAARAAVRAGAGLVTLAVPESVWAVEAVKNDEAMVLPLPADETGGLAAAAIPEILSRLERADVCLVGPGLGLEEGAREAVLAVLDRARCPVVVDADGITAVSAHIDRLDRASCPVILTPHDGEFLRLGGVLEGTDRLSAAVSFARAHRVTLVLKGHRTITAFPDGRVRVNTTGNPGMAKGGSGDVLAGMTAALIPLFGPEAAVPAAVWLHGRAGDLAAERFGEWSMTPSDILDVIPQAMR